MVLAAVVSGMCFSIIAVAYRMGMSRGVLPLHILGLVSVAGTVVFGLRSWDALAGGVPAIVFALGLAAGLAQYVILPLMRAGLAAGPLSPLWCALMLAFVPISLYTWLARGEAISGLQWASMAVAAGCVVLATMSDRGESPAIPGRPGERHHRLRYAFILVGMLALNAVNGVGLKELDFCKDSGGLPLKERFGLVFLMCLYAGIVMGVAADQLVTKRPPPPWRWTLVLAAMGTVGSVAGTDLLLRASTLHAAIVFPVNAVSSITSTAILATLFLHEKRAASWYASLACGLAAVVLANGDALLAYVRGSGL